MTKQVQTFQTPYGCDQYLMLEGQELVDYFNENRYAIESLMHSSSRWYGDTKEEFARKLRTGDEKLVAESDEFLEQISDQIPMTRGWKVVDDVVGAVPNVPNMISDVPQTMRRRQRTMKESAPLTIYMDLTSSGGISAQNVTRRGVVLLALTRVLVEHRPVALWVGASLGSGGHSATVAWRIDTAPLDLARAAYHVGATAMSRGFGYGVCHSAMLSAGGWPFSNYDLHCRTAEQRLAAVFPGTEIKYVPPIYLSDPLTADPVGWVKRVLNITEEE